MTAPQISYLPPPGSRLATTFVAAGALYPVVRALEASALIPLAFSRFRPVDGFLGWGLKPSAGRARRAALRRGLPFWTVEDGFLRSVGLGRNGAPTISFVVDDLGIYYDASRPSRLEKMIAQASLSAEERGRAGQFRKFLIEHSLSKYNQVPYNQSLEKPEQLAARTGRRILLVDQTEGDLSISGALASRATFATMIATARAENPSAELIFKLHPDHAAGLAGSAASELAQQHGLIILASGASPLAVLNEVDEVWTVSSQTGFEALLRGIPVTAFGVPFYAGWGLTSDRAQGKDAQSALARRRAPRTLDDLIHCALISYPVYADPSLHERISPEVAAERLVLWREQAQRIGRDHLCVGFSRWKRPHALAYLATAGGAQTFVAENKALTLAAPGVHVVAWGMKADDTFAEKLRAKGARFSRMEDGFIRSFGLGSNFLFPWSLCLDDRGIYYDARNPSYLEYLINSGPPGQAHIDRARKLREQLVNMGITKYNLRGSPPKDLRSLANGRPILLATGQVPDDFSIRMGCVLPESNLDFLTRVRGENPDAYIIYKEHPDVVSGNRPGRSDPALLRSLADLVIFEGDTAKWIEASDHVHVMTSLAGFEALMRGKPVTCWGAPFYAGWGLTHDKITIGRRITRPTLDELAGRTLIDYTFYRINGVCVPVRPELLLEYIKRHGEKALKTGLYDGVWGRAYRVFGYLVAQMAASLGQRRHAQLRASAGSRWPFFRQIPDRAERSGL